MKLQLQLDKTQLSIGDINKVLSLMTEEDRQLLDTVYSNKEYIESDREYLESEYEISLEVVELQETYYSKAIKETLFKILEITDQSEVIEHLGLITDTKIEALYLVHKDSDKYTLLGAQHYGSSKGVFKESHRLVTIQKNLKEDGLYFCVYYGNDALRNIPHTEIKGVQKRK